MFQVEWLCGGNLLEEDERIIFVSEGIIRKLLIDNIKMEEAGEYTNRVVSKETSTSALLTVNGWLNLFSVALSTT